MRRLAHALALAALFLAVPAPAQARDTPCWGVRCEAINAYRAEAGVAPLVQRRQLQRVARAWASELARTQLLAHNPDLPGQVRPFYVVGENVGVGPDWRTVYAAFMASPPHRANILDRDYASVGIGWLREGAHVWVVVVFRLP